MASTVHVPAGTGRAYWAFGIMFTFLVTGDELGGSYSTWLSMIPPGKGPMPHIHHREEEQFYVLEGTLEFSVNEQTIRVAAGDYVHVPRDTIHSFKNIGQGPARILATVSPAGFEGFLMEVGEVVTDPNASPPPVTKERIAHAMAIEARYGQETFPPA